jgi:hypothetical protein
MLAHSGSSKDVGIKMLLGSDGFVHLLCKIPQINIVQMPVIMRVSICRLKL